MFSSLLNSAKQAVSSLAEQPSAPEAPKETTPPTTSNNTQQPQGDFLSGLLNAAQEVGKVIADKSQEGAEATKQGASTAVEKTKETADNAAQITKEDLAKITEGLGSLVNKATEAYHNFNAKPEIEEEAVSKVDSQGGKIQVSSVHEHQETSKTSTSDSSTPDLLANLLGMAKEVGRVVGEKTQEGAEGAKQGVTVAADKTKDAANTTTQMSKEELAKIQEGIGALIAKASEVYQSHTAAKANTEETVTKVETSTGGAHSAEKTENHSDLLANIMSMAKDVGKVIGDKSQQGAEQVSGAAEKTKEVSKEDLEKIQAGIGALVAKASEAYKNYGKPATTAETKDTVAHDFSTSTPQVDDVEEEIGKVTTGGYTTENKISTPPPTSDNSHPTVEGDISVYLQSCPSTVCDIQNKQQEIANMLQKVKDVLASTETTTTATEDIDTQQQKEEKVQISTIVEDAQEAIEKSKTVASYIAEEAESITSEAMKASETAIGSHTFEAVLPSSGEETIQEVGAPGSAVAEWAASLGRKMDDIGSSTDDKTSDSSTVLVHGAHCISLAFVNNGTSVKKVEETSATEKTRETGSSFLDRAQQVGSTIVDTGSSVVDKSKEAGTAVLEGAQKVGSTIVDTGSSAIDKTKETTVAAGTAVLEGAQKVGSTIVDTGSSAIDKTKEAGTAVLEGAQKVGSTIVDTGSSAIDKTKETTVAAGTAVLEGAQKVGSTFVDTGSSVVDKTKETTVAAGTVVLEGAQKVGSTIVDTGSSAIDKTKETTVAAGTAVLEGAQKVGSTFVDTGSSVVDKTKETTVAAGTVVLEGAQKVGSTIVDTGSSAIDKTKETTVAAGTVVLEGAQKVGSTIVDTGSSAIDKTKETTVAAGTAVLEGAQNVGSTIVDTGSSAIDKSKEAGTVVLEGAQQLGSSTMDAGNKIIGKLFK